MGMSDMKEMDRGVMDPTGRGITKAGVIVAAIALVLNVLGLGLQIIMTIAQNS